MSQTNAVTKPSAKRDLRALLQSDAVKQQIALALPKHLTADRMTRVALTTINRTPKLLQCTPESLLAGLMLCSQVGLEPDGRNAHLIPYGDQCQVIFDWKGLVALARRNGVANIAADVVCEGDEFDWYRDGEGLHFTHRVNWKTTRGQVYAAYCIWKDGEQFDGEVMTLAEIDGIRKRSRAGNNGPWVTDWGEMAKKTVVRRASKKWPMDPEAAGAFNADDDSILPAKVDTTTRPIFAAPMLPEPEAPVPEPQPAASDDDGDLGPQKQSHAPTTNTGATAAAQSEPERQVQNEAPEPPPAARKEPPGETAEQTVKRQVKALKTLLGMKGHSEVDLIAFLAAQKGMDDSLGTLAEVGKVAPKFLSEVHDTFGKLEIELKAWKEAKAGV